MVTASLIGGIRLLGNRKIQGMGYFFDAYLEERKRYFRSLWIRMLIGLCGFGLAILAATVSYRFAFVWPRRSS
jgi:hypothetical protein